MESLFYTPKLILKIVSFTIKNPIYAMRFTIFICGIFFFAQTKLIAQLDSLRWRTVKSEYYSISYPKTDWIMFVDSIMGAPFIIATNATIKKQYDKDVVQLRIMGNDDNIYGDLDSYADKFKNVTNNNSSGIISSERVKKGDVEFYEQVVRNAQGKIKRKTKERHFFINQKVYLLTFDASETVFDKKIAQVDSILNSFIITDVEASTVKKWETFDTPQYAFIYPSNWKREQVLPQHTEFILRKPKKSTDKGYWDNIYLMVNTFKESTPELGNYSKRATEQLKMTLKNVEIQQTSKKKSGKLTYQEVISVGDLGKNRIKMRQWHFVKGKKAYTLTYAARVDGFNDLLPIVEQIFNSFNLK